MLSFVSGFVFATPSFAQEEAVLRGPGESCRAKSDCSSGLKCVSNTCRDEMEGAGCAAKSDCGGRLSCIESTCVVPGQSASGGGKGGSDGGKKGGSDGDTSESHE